MLSPVESQLHDFFEHEIADGRGAPQTYAAASTLGYYAVLKFGIIVSELNAIWQASKTLSPADVPLFLQVLNRAAGHLEVSPKALFGLLKEKWGPDDENMPEQIKAGIEKNTAARDLAYQIALGSAAAAKDGLAYTTDDYFQSMMSVVPAGTLLHQCRQVVDQVVRRSEKGQSDYDAAIALLNVAIKWLPDNLVPGEAYRPSKPTALGALGLKAA